jgi:hypothetical protein
MALPLISLEIFLGFGVPLAWGVWELWSLRRERRRDAERAAREQALAQASPPPTDTPARGPPS